MTPWFRHKSSALALTALFAAAPAWGQADKSGYTQIVLTPQQSEETEANGDTDKKSGFGDTILRLKYNFIGNDGGGVAVGIMPFVKIPTHSNRDMGNDQVEGGLILPVAVPLPGGWDMGMMVQANAMKNEADNKYHTEFVSSVTFGHAIAGELGGYAEFYSQASDETGSAWVGTTDFGLTYGVTPDLQLDMGVNIAATSAADDTNPFLGISARF